MFKRFLIYAGTFVAVIVSLWLLLVLTSLIPNESIRDNMEKSALSYSDKEAYQFTGKDKLNTIEDNYADAILLGVLWNIDSSKPFTSSLDTKYYDGEEYGESYGLYASIQGEAPNTDYSRYWHGSVIFIRPLMLLTDVNGIEIVGFIGIIILVAINCIMLIKRKVIFGAVGLIISLLCVQVWNVRLSLEYMPTFLIALFICILFMMLEKKGNTYLTALSVLGGAMAAFFDFLTTETLTILLPIILVFFIRANENRLGKLKDNIVFIVKCMIGWGMSYGMAFIVKWSAASLASGENKFITALSQAEKRMYGSAEGENISAVKQLLYAIPANLSTMLGGTERVDAAKVFTGILIAVLIAGSMFYLFRKQNKNGHIALILLILGVMPYIRYIALNNHSYLHEFFTYRAQCASILALWGIIWFNIDNPYTMLAKHKKAVRYSKPKKRKRP